MALPLLKPEFPPLLIPGFHPLSLVDLRVLCVSRFTNSIRRLRIMDGLVDIFRKLSSAGIIGEVWVDGSFVTEKIDPEDVDILIRVSSDQYDNDPSKRSVVDWASHEDRTDIHSCD